MSYSLLTDNDENFKARPKIWMSQISWQMKWKTHFHIQGDVRYKFQADLINIRKFMQLGGQNNSVYILMLSRGVLKFDEVGGSRILVGVKKRGQ